MRFSYCVLVFFVLISLVSCNQQSLQWVESGSGKYWQRMDAAQALVQVDSAGPTARVKIDEPLQTIEGFGICFNELGWDAVRLLKKDAQDNLLESLFDAAHGLNLTICRVPIGANDYSRSWYSLNDSAGDFEMRHFSLARDSQTLIPYIRSAMRYNPSMKIWASPWSPPAWMKTNNHYACKPDSSVNDLPASGAGMEGVTQFRMEEKYLTSYANYFSKFIDLYRKSGINLYAVHVQNEFNSCQNFPSCIWTASDLKLFIGRYLGPVLAEKNPGIEIWLGTYERPWVEKIDTILADPNSSKFISGVGFQWAGKKAIPAVNEKYPGLRLMQTESECGDGSNNWEAAEYTWSLMKHYFNHGVVAYMYWNPVLDETGKSQWGWKQNSLISIERNTSKITINPEYYLMKHLSAFVDQGAHFLSVEGEFSDLLAFRNPDGEIVIVCANTTGSDIFPVIQAGKTKLTPKLKAHSFHTFVMPQ